MQWREWKDGSRTKQEEGLVKLKGEDRQWKNKRVMEKEIMGKGGRSIKKRRIKKGSRREWKQLETNLGLVWKGI